MTRTRLTARELTYRALRQHRQGKLAFWVTAKAVYRGFREANYSRLGAFWQTLLEALTWPI